MAERGAPEGNQNATKNRPWAEVIKRSLLAEDGKKLRALADRLVDKALEGDVTALKEIGDRMDGKPKQQTELTGADGEAFVVRLEAQDSNL